MKTLMNSSKAALAWALVIGIAPVAAHAQSTDSAPPAPTTIADQSAQADDANTIVVVGYRKSLRAALDYKRRAVGAEDDIVAQDIAAFPDMNLAESIQRVAGVTITRDSGEGRQITLRGLGPDFTQTLLNGMQVLSNTASGQDNRGAVSRSRAFDFSLFASELFNRVSVKKSYTADQDEGGLGGTVALYSAKPFDYNGPKLVLSAKGQTNTNTSGVTPRVVALASDTWGDFGALVSVAYSQIKNNEYGYRNWGWGQVQYGAANIGPGVSAADAAKLQLPSSNPNAVVAPTAQTYSSWYTNRQRLGVTTALQYRPSNAFKVDLDLMYGRLWDHRDDWALGAAGPNGITGSVSGPQVLQSAVIDKYNSLVAGTYTGVGIRSEHHFVDSHTNFYQAALNTSWQATDRLSFTALAGYEQSDFREPVFDKVYMQAQNKNYSFDERSALPVNTYGFNLTDPTQWVVDRLTMEEDAISSKYVNGQLNAKYDLNGASNITVGASFKRFQNSGYQYQDDRHQRLGLTVSPDLTMTTNVDTLIPYIGGKINEIYQFLGQNRDLSVTDLKPGSNYAVTEKTWNGYIQYNLDTTIAGMHARANAGVHYYNTQLQSSGSSTNSSGVSSPISASSTVDGWLPAANLALDLRSDLVLRLSASQNINRPALADLNPSINYFVSQSGGGISLGNPALKPYKALNLEGSFEYYMGNAGFASIGFFYKKMSDYINSVTRIVQFQQTGLPASVLLAGTDPNDPNLLFTLSQPVNGKGADIKGIEVAFQHDFTFLPAPFDHLGVQANGTWFSGHQTVNYTDGNGNIIATARLSLPNLSKWAANGTLYYDSDRWGARVSVAYRSDYLNGTGSAVNIGDFTYGTTNIDAQAHINLTKKIKLVVEGINLTNERIAQYSDRDAKRLIAYTTSGRTFTFGVSTEF